MECNSEANQTHCNYTYEPCERKGRCCECLTYHLRMEELPACVFPADVEKTYGRSFDRFVKVHQGKSGKKN
jgi:hypothetical protein